MSLRFLAFSEALPMLEGLFFLVRHRGDWVNAIHLFFHTVVLSPEPLLEIRRVILGFTEQHPQFSLVFEGLKAGVLLMLCSHG